MFVHPASLPRSYSSNDGVQSKHTHTQRQTFVEECEVRMCVCVEKACVNFLWQQKEASVCTAFNNELKGNSGHVTQMKERTALLFPSSIHHSEGLT